jgi:transcriptional regulator NrdR family protein
MEENTKCTAKCWACMEPREYVIDTFKKASNPYTICVQGNCLVCGKRMSTIRGTKLYENHPIYLELFKKSE